MVEMVFDDPLMKQALELAKQAGAAGEVPVAAIVSDKHGKVIAHATNAVEAGHDPTAHAEIEVIKKACKALETTYLNDYILTVTLEPCAMCAQAISWAKVGELRFGAYDTKSGGVANGARVFDWPTCHHKPKIYPGIMERESGQILREFFQEKR